MIESIVIYINQYFNEYPGVLAVYLFGSFAEGESNRFSDVDIAVLFNESDVPDFKKKLNLMDELSAIIGRDVDLIVLNNSPVVLRMQVIKKGRLLIKKNPSKYNLFVVSTLKEYFDLKQVRQPIEKALSQVTIFD